MKNEDFKILSLKEEQKLNSDELHEYYEKLRNYLKGRKLQYTSPGATTIAPNLKNPTNKIADSLTKILTAKDAKIECRGMENIPNGTVIYAYTHHDLLDNFCTISKMPQHSIIVHGADVNKFLLMAQLNTGYLKVRKADKAQNAIAKEDIMTLLLNNHSVTWFPESTWCLSPNKLHLPLSWGFIDVAKKTNTPIVPAILHYEFDTSNDNGKTTEIKAVFAKPIYVNENDNLLDKLNEYDETISTIEYQLIEEKGIHKRSDISNEEYINYLKTQYRKLKLGKLDLQIERENIFGGKDDFYLFHPINDVPFDENGNLLEAEETRRLRKIRQQRIRSQIESKQKR